MDSYFIKKDGIALVCSMGDGIQSYATNIEEAFNHKERIHEESGQTMQVPATSCRIVSQDVFHQEMIHEGLQLIEYGTTSIEPDFPILLYAVISNI